MRYTKIQQEQYIGTTLHYPHEEIILASGKDLYVHFDELDDLPPLNRENYLFETDFLRRELAQDSSVLQVGSMDGMRATRLLHVRPDLKITGLEIEGDLVDKARHNIQSQGFSAKFVVGDITTPPASLSSFDFVICLNNTLGFIPNFQKALHEMRQRGRRVYVSVFGESFTNDLARAYYGGIGITIDEIIGDQFVTEDGPLRRFPRSEVSSWGGDFTHTPLGYLVTL